VTPPQFHELEGMEQMNAIFDKGIELAVREDDVHRCHLYQLYNFYVEEIWHKEDCARLVIKTFTSVNSAILKPYLDKIDISTLRK
jgi:hypothetical protein